jgi:hypothetical protein
MSAEEPNMRMAHVLLTALAMLPVTGCSDSTGDKGGLDMRSRSTGERNDRLGNDPAQQNTGEGSERENEPRPEAVPEQ